MRRRKIVCKKAAICFSASICITKKINKYITEQSISTNMYSLDSLVIAKSYLLNKFKTFNFVIHFLIIINAYIFFVRLLSYWFIISRVPQIQIIELCKHSGKIKRCHINVYASLIHTSPRIKTNVFTNGNNGHKDRWKWHKQGSYCITQCLS